MAPTDHESRSNLRRLRSRPVCIICGRPAEAQQLAHALGIDDEKHRLSGHDVSMVRDGHTFHLGEFELPSGDVLKYYITSSLRQGIQSFAVSAALLLNTLSPRFVLHAVVCAGFHDATGKLKLALRQVVFGEAAINYEEGKWEAQEPGGKPVFLPDYKPVAVEAGDMQGFTKSHQHQGICYGEYISGSAVRGDAAQVFEKIRSSVGRNAIALDMEASAFLQLCKYFEPKGPICLGVVKGISDFGDSKKGQDASAYSDALDNTAVAIKAWLTHRIPNTRWEVDESDEPGAKLVPGYYENFVRRVIDNYLEGLPIAYRHRPEVAIPASEIKGFISVLPKDQDPQFVKEIGQIQRTILDHGVEEINIGTNAAQRYVHYKAGYFIDWCRTVNSLVDEEDAEYQVGVFGRTLEKQAYYKQAEAKGPLARVLPWEEAMKLLTDLSDDSQTVPGPEVESLRVKPEEETPRADTQRLVPAARTQRKSSVSNLFAFARFRRHHKGDGNERPASAAALPVVGCK
ncbi:Phosphorylase superfamily protein [Metarhizium album ARSEF 1941]|uniref:Phosphorylase superfamily protein n=1 Tax=Metarhizium album (strain ARSEF 1941) TaxID=1081103 RepID=A0A0B2X223_METAS|nr:Phosphorylase superfamily protein [Metarhizium album ARSEF 1941]KHO00249.1 Phosphorylase superfamily protein [Metarhizium album ARSEF 1941]